MQTATSITALQGLVGTNNEIGILLGAVTPGDGGGGTFYYDTSSTLTENEGTIVKPTAAPGGIGRWLRIYGGPVNVRWFTKKVVSGNWSPAFQAAIQVNGAIYVPFGEYNIGTPITNVGDLSIEGESVGNVTLYTTANINILNFTNDESYITIKNLKLQARVLMTTGAAINIVGGGIRKVGIIENVWIMKLSETHSFKYGIKVTNPTELVLRDIIMEGNGTGTPILIGVDFSSNMSTISPTIQNVKVYRGTIGLQVRSGTGTQGIEGVKVFGCDFVDVDQGVVVDNGFKGPGFNFDSCHVNARVGCLSIKNINQVFISDSLLYMKDNATYGIDLFGVNEGSISCCKFYVIGSGSPYGVLANATAATSEIKVVHNYFRLNSTGNQTGIWFGPNSRRNQALYNTIEGVSSGTDVFNEGINNVLVGNIRHNIE